MEDENRDEPPASKPRRRAPAKKSAAAAARRKAPASRQAPARRKAPAKKRAAAGTLETMLRGFARKASEAGASVASISGEGVASARRAIGQAGDVSKSTIDRIMKEWQRMDAKKRAQFIAALLAALAAASAPLVRSQMKKR
ncbi:MAG: hypothetical protein LC796_16770 [Acidobacteria bacterium]|nr:hypothetical protein [Acidobacteriota bacterium]MCA1610090.1 hypothetical protein [Acidobacteriota bacterium]